MTGYVVRRLLQSLLVIGIVYTLTFAILFVLPGDPIENKIQNPVNPLPASTADALRAYYDFDKPAVVQFGLHVWRLLHGDLGYSLVNGNSVAALLGQAIGQTALLALLALVLTVLIAFGIALVAVFAPWRPLREVARAVPVLSISTPSFLIGYVLLVVFSFRLGLVSAVQDEGFRSYLLPALTLAFAACGTLAQVLIQGLSDAAERPFVTVLTAKGLSGPRIVFGHVLRNGAIPSITLLALIVGDLLAGAVVVETVFNRSGLGYFTYTSVRDQDTPVIEAIVLLVSTVYVLVNLLTDLAYPKLDPRIATAAAGPRRASSPSTAPREVAA